MFTRQVESLVQKDVDFVRVQSKVKNEAGRASKRKAVSVL